jgi:peptidoglycan hydrolase CwlO-like protein
MNRRLNALRVGNFKAFSATQRIPLKPITLVFGPNSAGKSSFIHSLALAHEAQFGREKRGRSRLDVHHTDIGGASIDLGGFRQFIFRGQLNRRMEWGAELKVSALDPIKDRRLAELLAPVETIALSIALGIELEQIKPDQEERPKPGAEPRVDSIEISANGEELLRMSWRPTASKVDGSGTVLRVDRLAAEHTVFRQVLGAIVENQTTSEQMRPEDFEVASEAIAILLPQLIVRVEKFFPSSVELPKTESAELSPASILFPVSKGDRKEDIAQAIRFFLPRILNDLIKGLTDALADELGQLQYLGPLRSFPPRHLAFVESEDANWYAGGGYAWDVVRRDDAVRLAVNSWLGAEKLKTRYKLVVRTFRALEDLHEPIASALDGFDDWRQSRESETSELQGEVDALNFQIQDLELEISDLELEISGLEDSCSELEDEINQLQSEIDGAQLEIDEAESELASAETVRDLIEEALERDADEQVKKDLASAHSKAGEEVQTQEWERDALNGTRDEKQSEIDDKQRELSQKQSELEEKQDELADKQNELENRQGELDGKQSELNPYLGADMSEDRTEELLEVLKASDSESIRELALIDQRTGANVSHRDVGIGISQVLPVLVMAYGSRGRILAMEQPEIHLHPALQAELGDVFIEAALGERKNTFILETHSEHLILRLLRRIRETSDSELAEGLTPIRPEDIAVIYVQPGPRGSEAVELHVTPDGDFKNKWPDGFFAERAQELF